MTINIEGGFPTIVSSATPQASPPPSPQAALDGQKFSIRYISLNREPDNPYIVSQSVRRVGLHLAQTEGTTANGNPTGTSASDSASGIRSWITRDPLTGRLFQQELVSVMVPTTRWEVKPVPTTVYEPQSVVKSVPSQQTIFTPSTQYVMQPKLRGWWNPMRAPVQAYEFVPVTSWQPQTQTVQQQVTAVEWIPRQQVVYVPQAVQTTQTQQQLVSRELPQPTMVPMAGPNVTQTMLAAQPRPLITFPFLAQQRSLPWPSYNQPSYNQPSFNQPSFNQPSGYASPVTTTVRNVVSSGLRPIAGAITPTYSAPLPAASSAAVASTRDALQTGMSATILR